MMWGVMPRRLRADGEEEESIHVSSVPDDLRAAVAKLAEERTKPKSRVLPRDIYAEAISDFLSALDAGTEAEWLASRQGGRRLMALPSCFWPQCADISKREANRSISELTRLEARP
jgi:predicted transcriptional regulator